jgi:hypothetical protein
LWALIGYCVVSAPAAAQTPFAELLPEDSLAIVRISNFAKLREGVAETQLGKLIAEPAMKPFIDSVLESIEELGVEFQKEAGLSFKELIALPHGEVALAVLAPDDEDAEEGEEPTPGVIVLLNVGPNVKKSRELLDRMTAKLVEEEDYEKEVEEVQGTEVTTLTPGDDADESAQDVVWCVRDSVVIVANGDVVADVLGRWDGGADETLAKRAAYQRVLQRTGEEAQIHFYVDLPSIANLVSGQLPFGAIDQNPQAEQIFKLLGFDSFRAIGGSVAFGEGAFDTVVKLMVHYETPPRGLTRAIHFAETALEPEKWVPADVISYSTVNFSFGELFGVIDEIVEQFQPGGVSAVLQAVLAAQGVDFDVKREFITPLGKRVTFISDFGKPGDLDSQRLLFAMALNDGDVIAATLTKLLAFAGPLVSRREFKSHTIHEVTVPAQLMAAAGQGGDIDPNAPPVKLGICVAEGQLFIAHATLLEKVLLHAGEKRPGLAGTPKYKAIARHLPAEAGGIGFSHNEEEVRAAYAMLKAGKVKEAIAGSLPIDAEWLTRLADALDGSNLPDFDTIKRYLTDQGMYITADKDGLMFVQFQLAKER